MTRLATVLFAATAFLGSAGCQTVTVKEIQSEFKLPKKNTEYVITGSKDYVTLRDAIHDKPNRGNHSRPQVKIELIYPDDFVAGNNRKYPLVVLIPSSQGIEEHDEIRTAHDFRKFGYATLIVYSYKSRNVGGDDAETGKSINSPTMALDALIALKQMESITAIEFSKTALYGASKGSLALEETMITALSEKHQLPTYRILLSENSNFCIDMSALPLRRDVKLVVFTGGKDDSGTPRECVERTKIYKAKGYDIEHIKYEEGGHRFIIDSIPSGILLPKQTEGYGYSKCKWLLNNEGLIGYQVKSTGVSTFPEDRKTLKETIGACLNVGIWYGGTPSLRRQFFKDAHAIMQKAFNN